ncbi:MAG: Dabb family protein [Ruminococcaceae bacterium]|nr:Dabb family protein [Oscillospiraceae bacterium]
MVKHMIIWKFKEDLEDTHKLAEDIKNSLEGLVSKIDGLLTMNIIIEKLPSSSGDIMMDSAFEDEQALKDYQVHPLHLEIANNLVRPYMETRLCVDYKI